MQRQVTVARSQLRELRTTADTSQARLLDNSQRQGKVLSHLLPFLSLSLFSSENFYLDPMKTLFTDPIYLLFTNMYSDQETIARLAEADLVTQDLERANSRVAEVERRNEKLRSEIEAIKSGSESTAR